MSARRHLRAWPPLCMMLGATLGACVQTPDFPDESLIDRPRVLAMVAQPPELAPGDATRVSLMLALPRDREAARPVDSRFSLCAAFFTTLRGSQYDDQPEQGCGGSGLSVTLPASDDGLSTRVPAGLTASLFGDLELAARALGAELPADTIDAIRQRVGLPLVIEADLKLDDLRLRAVKRILVSENPEPNRNPPAPHFELLRTGDAAPSEIVADPDASFRCVAAGGEAVHVQASSSVELAPRTEGAVGNQNLQDAGEPWLERYQVLNARGELEQRVESAFYSWFSDGGSLSEDVTKAPLRNTVWHTPAAPGSYALYVVVRDGHGGSSACKLDVEVR